MGDHALVRMKLGELELSITSACTDGAGHVGASTCTCSADHVGSRMHAQCYMLDYEPMQGIDQATSGAYVST